MAIVSCHKKNKEVVDVDIIPEKRMIEIIHDVQLIEAKINYRQSQGGLPQKLTIEYYNGLFKKFNINRLEFEKSIEYYAERPSEFENIYMNVLNNYNTIH